MAATRLAVIAPLTLAIAYLGVVAQVLSQERLDHLLQAAEHLERAGLPDKAAEVRTLAGEELRAHGAQLLQQKLSQLAALNEEIERLRRAVAPVPQVKLQLQVSECSLEKLDASGLGLVSLRQLLTNSTMTAFVDESGKVTDFIDLLRRQGVLTTTAAPVLIASAGVPASVLVRASSAAGYRWECTPRILDGGHVRLTIRCQQADAAGGSAEGSTAVDGQRPCVPDVTIDVPSGRPLIIGGARAKRDGTEEVGLLMLLTVEIMPAAEPRAGAEP